jgi:hypothetical protein
MEKRKPGRPKKNAADRKHRYEITLSNQSAKDLIQIGGGNRSKGIEEVLAYYLKHAFRIE